MIARTIRGRLTLWYTAILFAVLVVFGAWVDVVDSHLRVADLDAELRRAGATVAAAVGDEMNEGASLPEAAAEAYKEFGTGGRLLAMRDEAGAAIPGLPDGLPDLVPTAAESATFTRGGEDWRLHVGRHRHGTAAFQVLLAEPLRRTYGERTVLRRTLLVGIPLALALAAGGGFWIARRALSPLRLMAGQARHITDRTPAARLHAPHPGDELGLLAGAFNDLLARLAAALDTQRRFMADASHELRTPVSILRTAAEVTLGREARSEQEYRESLRIVADQAGRLARMVDDMMILARADAGGIRVDGSEFYLDELVSECADDAAVLAGDRNVVVRAHSMAEVSYRGDERLLRQMVMNLLDNGVRHTAAGGEVRVEIAASEGALEIAVTDTGSGVPADDRERIFQRFVRLDPARRQPGGAGLGLPIARTIAEAHGGSLTLAASGPEGSRFVARLPRAPRDARPVIERSSLVS